jgi:MFS family permease
VSAPLLSRVRASLTSEVAALCLVIFLADVVAGIIIPSFSLYARDLGVSLALLGAINTLGGITQLGASIPLGVFSDRIGRTRVVMVGLSAFLLAMLAFAVADGPWMIAVGRVLQGIAVVATFQIGAAYLGDITAPGQRAVAFGSYTTAMGLGFTVGPLVGGAIAEEWGARESYLVAAGVALLSIAVAKRLLHDPPRPSQAARPSWYRDLGLLAKQHDLTLVALGNLLTSLTFAGAISTFLPLYARESGISQATIGTMFAVRALVSAAGRIPNSIVTKAVGDQPVLFGALALQVVVLLGIAWTDDVVLLTILLALDGLAFGGYLVAGQTYVADHTDIAHRGAAVGLYSALGSIGGITGPLALGIVADVWDVRTTFTVNGVVMIAGCVLYLIGTIVTGVRIWSRPGRGADTGN